MQVTWVAEIAEPYGIEPVPVAVGYVYKCLEMRSPKECERAAIKTCDFVCTELLVCTVGNSAMTEHPSHGIDGNSIIRVSGKELKCRILFFNRHSMHSIVVLDKDSHSPLATSRILSLARENVHGAMFHILDSRAENRVRRRCCTGSRPGAL